MSQPRRQKPLENYLHVLRQDCISFGQTLKVQLVTSFHNLDKSKRYLLLLIFLAALALRLVFLWQPIRYDEAFTYLNYASKPLFIGISNYSFPNNHLFHTLLVHFSCLVFGSGLWALRLPAFIAGVLTVPANYAVAYRFSDQDSALMAAGLVACSSFLIEYSTNARGYTLICLFFLLLINLAMYLYCQRNRFVWLCFAVISAVGFYTIPIMLYPYTIVTAWLAVLIWQHHPERRLEVIKDIIIYSAVTLFITLLFYMPVIVIMGWAAILANKYVLPLSFAGILAQLPLNLQILGNLWIRDFPLAVLALLGLGFIGFLGHLRKFHYGAGLLAACLGFCPLLAFAVQRVVPFQRVWLFMLPLIFAFCSMGLSALTKWSFSSARLRRSFLPVLTIVVVGWTSFHVVNDRSIIYSRQTGVLLGGESIAATLQGKLHSGDCVLSGCPSDVILRYYFKRRGMPLTYLRSDPTACQRIFVVVNEFEHQTLKIFGRIKGRESEAQIEKKFEGATLYCLRSPKQAAPGNQ
jgi:hypothetical protein